MAKPLLTVTPCVVLTFNADPAVEFPMIPAGAPAAALPSQFLAWLADNDVDSVREVGSMFGGGRLQLAFSLEDAPRVVKWWQEHGAEYGLQIEGPAMLAVDAPKGGAQ